VAVGLLQAQQMPACAVDRDIETRVAGNCGAGGRSETWPNLGKQGERRHPSLNP